MLLKHTLRAPPGLRPCKSVLEIGPGIRPFEWYRPERYICAEPYEGYAEILEDAGFIVIRETALQVLAHQSAEAIYMLDVIEHMTRADGLEVIELTKRRAERQVVIYTPSRFVEQSADAWGLGGDHWQTHRSAWTPEDFDGWETSVSGKGFFAIWDRQ